MPNARPLPRMPGVTESSREGAARHRPYTLTPAHVRAHAQHLCPKHLRLKGHGPRCTAGLLWAALLYAASRITSLAAAWGALLRAPCDTAVPDARRATLPDTAELQRRVHRALPGALPRALRRCRQPLAIDRPLVPYRGRPRHDAHAVDRSQAKSGTGSVPAYAVRRGLRCTAALTWGQRGEPL
jgi:hypothetical protein